MDEHFINQCKFTDAITLAAGASASTAVNGATLDMLGFRGVVVIVKTGPITAGAATSIKIEQSAASDMSDPTDITGSAQTIADDDDNQSFIVDILRPPQRYLRVVVSRATQVATVTAMYIQYGSDNRPVTQPTSVVTLERFKDPVAGVA